MKSKDQVQLEEAYQSINEAPFKFNDANSFHSDEGYDTGSDEAYQGPAKTPPSGWKRHPATVRAYKKLMSSIEEHVDDMPPDLLDKAIARLEKAKKAWGQ